MLDKTYAGLIIDLGKGLLQSITLTLVEKVGVVGESVVQLDPAQSELEDD